MDAEKKPEITHENKAEQLNLNPGELGYMDNNGILHKAGSLEELRIQMESFREEER